MGRSQESFSKREKEKKKAKKKKDKLAKREQRNDDNNQGGSLDDMMAYVDEFGNITDTPPDESKVREEIEAEDIVIGVPKKEDSGEPEVNVGVVAFYDSSKGFGFINDNSSGEKYFFHVNNVTFDINENDKVTFDIVRGRKGMDAVNVQLV